MNRQSNKRKIIIQNKEYDSLESAAKAFGKSRNTVDYRLSKGWSPEQAVGLVPPPSFASKRPYLKSSALRGHRSLLFIQESLLFYYHKQVVHLLMIVLSKFQAIDDFHALNKVAVKHHQPLAFSSK
jgi:hypothetical protein